jgi:hypothetical protein
LLGFETWSKGSASSLAQGNISEIPSHTVVVVDAIPEFRDSSKEFGDSRLRLRVEGLECRV